MKLSISEIVVIAKDRAIDQMTDYPDSYSLLSEGQRETIRELASFISMPDDKKETLKIAEKLNLVSGDEDEFYY